MNAAVPVPIEAPLVASPQEYDAKARSYGRYAAIAAGILAALFVFGAVLIPIGGAIIASAEVAPESRIKRIAHPTGGVISEILVADGDVVEEGDVLIRFETNVSEIDAEFSERSLAQLLARRARLEAEIENRDSIRFPAELLDNPADEARAAIAAEQRRFGLGASERSSLAAQLRERVNQLERQIEGYGAQIAAFEAQQALIVPELETVREAFEDGYVTIRRLNELERTAIELDGSIGSLRSNIAQANAAIAQANQQRIQLGQTARSDAGDELAQVEAAINQQRVASVSAGDQFERSVITASHAGTVDKLAFGAVGEVVRPAQTMLEIVPRNDTLVLNGLVLPSDIDRVETGQPTRVRLSAFNQATTPELTGEVTFVSPDPITNETTGARLFRVRVSLDPGQSDALAGLSLVSGMPAELFIETGNRSLISYVTKPLVDQFSRAFRN